MANPKNNNVYRPTSTYLLALLLLWLRRFELSVLLRPRLLHGLQFLLLLQLPLVQLVLRDMSRVSLRYVGQQHSGIHLPCGREHISIKKGHGDHFKSSRLRLSVTGSGLSVV